MDFRLYTAFVLLSDGHRIGVKYGGQGQSDQAIKLFQELQKISFTFHFWRKSFILDDAKLAELSNNSFEWKNVAFLGGGGVKTYSDPPTWPSPLSAATNDNINPNPNHTQRIPAILSPVLPAFVPAFPHFTQQPYTPPVRV